MTVIEQALQNILKYSDIKDENFARSRLMDEFVLSGINVLMDFIKFKQANEIDFFEYSSKMDAFYTNTDAFIFELSAWHSTYERHIWKINMVNHFNYYVTSNKKLKILMIGDGIGYDSLYIYNYLISNNEFELNYFEFDNSKSFKFAKNLFLDKKANINMIGQLDLIRKNYYDIIVCLDVLEHVPNPEVVIKNFFDYLNGGGVVYVSEGFKSIVLLRPTHLKCNMRYVGNLIKMFSNKGFCFVDKLYPRIFVFSKDYANKASILKLIKNILRLKISKLLFMFRYKEKSSIELEEEYKHYEKVFKDMKYAQ